MRWYKIFALMYADLLLVKNRKWRVMEYLYFPITTIIIYGLFSVFMRAYALEAGLIVFVVNIMWAFAQLAQMHVNMTMNEDSWSGSLKQIIVTGVGDFEYISARILSSIAISIPILALLLGISAFAFDLSIIFQHWQVFAALFLATFIASIGLSVFLAGAMIALGREYSFLAWTAMQLFILLSAPFYPISIFPEIMRPIVIIMPYTQIFEAARHAISGNASMDAALYGVYVSIAYFLISLPFYKYIFRKARQKGWLVRLG